MLKSVKEYHLSPRKPFDMVNYLHELVFPCISSRSRPIMCSNYKILSFHTTYGSAPCHIKMSHTLYISSVGDLIGVILINVFSTRHAFTACQCSLDNNLRIVERNYL